MAVKSLKALVADFDVSLEPTTIFNALVRAGYVEDFEYPSTTGSGQMKSFKKILPHAERFGENRAAMHPFKTEARFYAEHFPELLAIVVDQLQKEVANLQKP